MSTTAKAEVISVLYSPTLPPSPTTRLPPDLHAALSELAVVEDLPLAALIAVLLNEALERRLRGR
jgi:hypothetical protein